jgi:hypothetical protein
MEKKEGGRRWAMIVAVVGVVYEEKGEAKA